MPEEDVPYDEVLKMAKRCNELADTVELAVDLLKQDEQSTPITIQVIQMLEGVL